MCSRDDNTSLEDIDNLTESEVDSYCISLFEDSENEENGRSRRNVCGRCGGRKCIFQRFGIVMDRNDHDSVPSSEV